MKLLDATPNLYTLDFANKLVAELNSDLDDNWRYEVVNDPQPRPTGAYSARIDAYDELNKFAGSF